MTDKDHFQQLATDFKKFDDLVLRLEKDLFDAKTGRSQAREKMLEAITRYDIDNE